MELKVERYISKLYAAVTDAVVRRALQDLAQKLELLARDVSGGLVFVGGILITLGECPDDWEVVVELVGRVPLGTVKANKNVGTAAGSMTHKHAMPHTHNISAATGVSTGSTNIDAHTHTGGAHAHPIGTNLISWQDGDGAHGSVSVNEPLINTGSGGAVSTGNATTTAHAHTVPDHAHGGATGASSAADTSATDSTGNDATPAHVKVLFCRRIRPESR